MVNLNKVMMTVLKHLTDIGVEINNNATFSVEVDDNCMSFCGYSTDGDKYTIANLIVAESHEALVEIISDARRYSRKVKKVLIELFQVGELELISDSKPNPEDYKPEIREFCEIRDEYDALRDEVSKIDFNPWHEAMGHELQRSWVNTYFYGHEDDHHLESWPHITDMFYDPLSRRDQTYVQQAIASVGMLREQVNQFRQEVEEFREACKNPDFWANGGNIFEG